MLPGGPPKADRGAVACYPDATFAPETFDFEEALGEFCRGWSEAVAARSPIVDGRLFHKTVNCQVAGGPSFAITFTPQGAQMRLGSDPAASATLTMSEADWRNVLGGRYSVWSVQLAGRQRDPELDMALVAAGRGFGARVSIRTRQGASALR